MVRFADRLVMLAKTKIDAKQSMALAQRRQIRSRRPTRAGVYRSSRPRFAF
jgi:hypothetical protein